MTGMPYSKCSPQMHDMLCINLATQPGSRVVWTWVLNKLQSSMLHESSIVNQTCRDIAERSWKASSSNICAQKHTSIGFVPLTRSQSLNSSEYHRILSSAWQRHLQAGCHKAYSHSSWLHCSCSLRNWYSKITQSLLKLHQTLKERSGYNARFGKFVWGVVHLPQSTVLGETL